MTSASLCQDFGLQQLHCNFFPQKNYNYVQSLKKHQFRTMLSSKSLITKLKFNYVENLAREGKERIFLVRLSVPVICTVNNTKL